MSGRQATVVELSQALYDVIAPQVQAIVLTDGGGNAALSALACLLGQVYDQAPDEIKAELLHEILHNLHIEPAADDELPELACERPKRVKPQVH